MKFKTTDKFNTLSQSLLNVLITQGYLVEFTDDIRESGGFETIRIVSKEEAQTFKEQIQATVVSAGMPIESNIEKLAKHYLGICEDRKLWVKELKAAVREHGHDEILTSFEQWAEAQGTFMGRKPVTQFLKNVGNNVGTVNRPAVTNPNLTQAETRIAYITNNAVFFSGDYRLKLAQLLKEHGNVLVEAAFAEFFQNVDDRGLPWAARDFLQRAQVIINTIKIKKQEAARQEASIKQAYNAAAQSVDEVEEEDEGL